MNEEHDEKAPKSSHEKVMGIATVVIALLAMTAVFDTLPFKYAVIPAALVLLLLFAKFRSSRAKIRQASTSMVLERKKQRRKKEGSQPNDRT